MRYVTSLDEAFEVILSYEQCRACVIIDLSRPDNPIVWVTPEFECQMGYEKSEALVRNPRFLDGPQTDRTAISAIEDAGVSMTRLEIETHNDCKDGTLFWNGMSIRPGFFGQDALKSLSTFQSRGRQAGSPLRLTSPPDV